MSAPLPDYINLANLSLIEEFYQKYRENPQSVETSWRYFFEGMQFGGSSLLEPSAVSSQMCETLQIALLIRAYRRFGHLAVLLDPLGKAPPFPEQLSLEALGFSEAQLDISFPTLGICEEERAPLREIIEALKRVYAGKIGFEYMDSGHAELEKQLSELFETPRKQNLSQEEQLKLWEILSKAEGFEQFLHRKYVGQTRFSLEGGESLVPLLLEILAQAAEQDVGALLIGMAHRGRLNVLAHVLGKPYRELLEEFEDDTILSRDGHDDVKYHMGFSGEYLSPSGKKIAVSMAPNPSHLESIDPIALGQVRAWRDLGSNKACALLIHGDAALAGQGVIYETLQLMDLPSYTVGGTIHIVVNNQLGYTTSAEEGRSTRYCTDIAKTFGAPVFHVSAECPEECLLVAKLAVEIRQQFQRDVFIDLVCYRKYGHNEGDEPSYTQPLQYQAISTKPSIYSLYTEKMLQENILTQQAIDSFVSQHRDLLAGALESVKQSPTTFPKSAPRASLFDPFPTAVTSSTLQQIASVYCRPKPPFQPHAKLNKWLSERLQAVAGDPQKPLIDWSTAECLAFGSLLLQSVPIRLAGQDAQRGTFSQRHLILVDEKTGQKDSPLQHLGKTPIDIVNSPLTEFAGMGFEYGYTWGSPQTLVLWEAQYGDFYNGAQVIIDQYLASAEHKWNTPSSLTLLLPHAYEGAGPEHSSARLERFLQLAAEDNIQIVNASTPAQYFHLLRRQALRPTKKPLVVFTPKSLLRSYPSPLQDLTSGSFQEILNDPTPPTTCTKVLLCSGKIFHELFAERAKRQIQDVAIIRIEQLYPLHTHHLQSLLSSYKTKHYVWVQEESQNAGAWSFIQQHLPLLYAGRPPNSTTATGSHKKHKKEQQELLDHIFGGFAPKPPPKG